MGCSLDLYRARIGTFNNNKIIKLIKTNKNNNTSRNRTTNPVKIITLILILISIIASTHYTTRTAHNKAQHTLNGNNTLKLLHWNKGKSHFHNKTNKIDNILSLNKPHIFSICEANAKKETNDNQFNNYMDYKI